MDKYAKRALDEYNSEQIDIIKKLPKSKVKNRVLFAPCSFKISKKNNFP